jgi:Thioredoxin-like domain
MAQADESPTQFWAFVEAWSGRGGGGTAAAAGAQGCWAQVVTAAAAHVPPSVGRLLPVVLASRQYSPRLELFATLAAESAPSEQVNALPQNHQSDMHASSA